MENNSIEIQEKDSVEVIAHAKVSSQYQITLNKDLKNELNIISGDTLKFSKINNKVIIENLSLQKEIDPLKSFIYSALYNEVFEKIKSHKNVVVLLEFKGEKESADLLSEFINFKRLSVEISDFSKYILERYSSSKIKNYPQYSQSIEHMYGEIERFKDHQNQMHLHYLAASDNQYSEEQFGSKYETDLFTSIEKDIPLIAVTTGTHANVHKKELFKKWKAEKIVYINFDSSINQKLEIEILNDETTVEKYGLL